MKKILFMSSEVFPLIKTGGLADVSGSLPIALSSMGHDVRILMPAYPSAVAAGDFKPLRKLGGASESMILEGKLPGTNVSVLALSHDLYFSREGNPYLDQGGSPWTDNAQRFAMFCRVGVEIAMDRLGLNWKPDIVHCNDWQTGLVPALLSDETKRPATVFTIHNLAYQGVFPQQTFLDLQLPSRLWSSEALEFYGQVSFIKGGLVFADRVTTVSPTYAKEIQTSEFGCGLEGLLTHRNHRLSGILNGIDEEAWNPATDPYLPEHFELGRMENRSKLKAILQTSFGLKQDASLPILAWVGRLVDQKGIDLLIESLPTLMNKELQIVMIGSGESRYERVLQQWGQLFPNKFSIRLGYDEARAHLVEAAADLFLMPSRFEPCGLNQMYSQRYGAIPLVRKAGGLADTVVDASEPTLENGLATGFVFTDPSPEALIATLERAIKLFQTSAAWKKIQTNGMSKNFSWQISAAQYEKTYDLALNDLNPVFTWVS